MGRSGDFGDFSLEATSLGGSISDADFEPPYPVQDIPGLNFPTEPTAD